jgi:hypothetical protein
MIDFLVDHEPQFRANWPVIVRLRAIAPVVAHNLQRWHIGRAKWRLREAGLLDEHNVPVLNSIGSVMVNGRRQ